MHKQKGKFTTLSWDMDFLDISKPCYASTQPRSSFVYVASSWVREIKPNARGPLISRAVDFTTTTKHFSKTLHHKPEYGEKRLYFNCEKDILWYNGLTSGNLPAVMQLFGKGDIKKIRKIAMDWLAWFNLFKLSSQNKRFLVGMRILWLLGVEEVFVLVGPANAHQGYAYESRWGSFEPATEIDPANERCYWQDLRKVLVVPDLTVASLEAAFRDKAMEVRKERLAEMDNLIAGKPQPVKSAYAEQQLTSDTEGKAIEADFEADGKYKHLGGREPWTLPNIRFVEVNMST